MVHDRLDVVKVQSDDERRAVGNAGVLLVATLAKRNRSRGRTADLA